MASDLILFLLKFFAYKTTNFVHFKGRKQKMEARLNTMLTDEVGKMNLDKGKI